MARIQIDYTVRDVELAILESIQRLSGEVNHRKQQVQIVWADNHSLSIIISDKEVAPKDDVGFDFIIEKGGD